MVQTDVAKGIYIQEGLAVTLKGDATREEWDQPKARQREWIKVPIR